MLIPTWAWAILEDRGAWQAEPSEAPPAAHTGELWRDGEILDRMGMLSTGPQESCRGAPTKMSMQYGRPWPRSPWGIDAAGCRPGDLL